MIKCPYCGSGDVFYTQVVEEFHSVGGIDKKGSIDLLSLEDSFVIGDQPDGFFCSNCDKKYPLDTFVKKYNGIM